MGATALITAPIAARARSEREWLAWWLGDAVVAVLLAVVTMTTKARRLRSPLLAPPSRRFALAYVPPLVAGAALTPVFVTNNLVARLPGCWLLLYGVAIATGGALSVRVVQIMGALFMVLGIAAFAAPASFGDVFMAAGFGVLHVVFGAIIARNHGG